MDKDLIRDLLPLYSSKEVLDSLSKYAEMRIKYFQVQLETEQSLDRIRSYQGAISELKRLITLHSDIKQRISDLDS